jgi:hypothetical protein
MQLSLKSILSLLLLVMVTTLWSCSGCRRNVPEVVEYELPDSLLVWNVDDVNKTITRNIPPDTMLTNPQQIVIRVVSISNDTIYTKIDNAEYLTQRAGTYGASEYISTVVINLTSLPNIRYVNIDFIPGSHASPGVFTKDNYSDYKEVDPSPLEEQSGEEKK